MLDRNLAIQHGRIEACLAGRQDHHEVGIRGELEDEEAEARARLVLHADELLGVAGSAGEARDALLEVLHDVGHALEAVFCGVVLALGGGPGRDGEEGGALKEEQLLGLDGNPEVSEVALNDGEVGDKVVDDGGPGFIETLVPYRCRKGDELDATVLLGAGAAAKRVREFGGLLSDEADTVVKHVLAGRGDNEVHLVDEDVDLGGRGVLEEGGEDGHVGGKVALDVAGLDIEDVDEDADVGEDVDALLCEVVFHKGLLATAVPQVKCEVAEELDMGQIDIDGGASAVPKVSNFSGISGERP